MYEKLIKQMGFEKLTPIQSETISKFNNKKNLVGVAPTGTGKTHAYLLPLIANINEHDSNVQAIILVPTNELIHQVKKMLDPLISEAIRVKAYDSKTNKVREYSWLEKYQPQIVISTPERIVDFNENGLKINTAKYLILDEADMMFDESFMNQVDQIIVRIPNAKYLLFSASITEDMYTFIKKYFGIYDLIDTTKEHQLKIEHRLIKSKSDNRRESLKEVLKTLNPYFAIIFVSRKDDQSDIYNLLQDLDLNVGLLSSNLNQHQRKNMIKDIRDLKYQYIVASDLASRGLDFDVSHVINYDLPHKLEFFKHRSGRTGRMEKEGIVITIALNSDRHRITRLEEMGFKFTEYRVNNQEMIKVSSEKTNKISNEEAEAIKKIPKPKKIKPNYKKKNKEKVVKAKNEVRRKNYAKNR